MATVRRRVVSEPAAAGTTVRLDRERSWSMDGSGVVSLVAGLLYAVIGLLVLLNIGLSDFPSEETTQVMGFTQTQLWGCIGIGIGLILLAGAAGYSRGTTMFGGALLVVMGIVIVASIEDLDATMATEEAFGWFHIVTGVIVLLAAIAIPTVFRRDRVVDDRVVADNRVVEERVVDDRTVI